MAILERILNSFVFWGAWIIIPVLVEIIPSLGSLVLLTLRYIKKRKPLEKPVIYPEISLIVPVYNSESTLYACIKSINDSSYPTKSIRVFIVNNMGKDNSFSVFAKCQRDFPELSMQWLNAQQGKSRAMNLALYNSEGKYIINLDSDGILEKNALTNMVDVFENDLDLNVMTGSILIQPELIEQTESFLLRSIQKLEFMEYVQAFLAGRSYASMTNSIYTLSGAFSAFRKQAMLKSRMYNTDTICEDTQITFQMRYVFKERIEVCENAFFMVDPIESVNKLYTQRQRWQRGSLEVAKMFQDKSFRLSRVFKDVNVKTVVFDHTFALPRLIWYLATVYLLSVKYSGKALIYSSLLIYALYVVIGVGYFLYAQGFMKVSPEMRKYYWKHFGYVFLLPLFNFGVFFIRVAGIINSISSDSSWKTSNLTDERKVFLNILREDMEKPLAFIRKLSGAINRTPKSDPSTLEGAGESKPDENTNTDSPATGKLTAEGLEDNDLMAVGTEKKKDSVTGWIVLGGCILWVMFCLFFAAWFTKANFGVGLTEIINTLKGPIEGTGAGMKDVIVRQGVIPCLLVTALGVVILTVAWLILRKSGRKVRFAVQSFFLIGCAVAPLGLMLFLNSNYGVMSYVKASGTETKLYEKYYVDPNTVKITSDGEPNNLIYIYLESMEWTYASREDGGYQNVNYMPNLTRLAKENIAFGDLEGLGGFHMVEGTTWTMAGLMATTAGVLFYRQELSTRESFVPGITNLGDVLKQNGYNQKFICGSEAWFANRDVYFKTHGDYEIVDYYNAVEKQYVPEDYYVNWGIEDYRLFEIAQKEILEAAGKDAPFNCTILTVDTHTPNGFICDVCETDYEGITPNVVACTDRLVQKFLDWCEKQDFYENTTIVITGDHPRMDGSLVEGVSYYDRRVYDCFINSRVEPERDNDNRMVLAMDIFPSTLAAMGFEIEGDKLGLGTNLFSKQDTLAEKIGFSKVYAESAKKSSFYVENFHQVNAK